MELRDRWMAIIIQLPLLGWFAVCAAAPEPDTADIPASLQVPATEELKRQTHGVGVQIYQCQAAKDDAARGPRARPWLAGGVTITGRLGTA